MFTSRSRLESKRSSRTRFRRPNESHTNSSNRRAVWPEINFYVLISLEIKRLLLIIVSFIFNFCLLSRTDDRPFWPMRRHLASAQRVRRECRSSTAINRRLFAVPKQRNEACSTHDSYDQTIVSSGLFCKQVDWSDQPDRFRSELEVAVALKRCSLSLSRNPQASKRVKLIIKFIH